MSVNKDDLKRVSALAMIDITDDSRIEGDINRLLEHFSRIQDVDLSHIVQPMVLPPQCILIRRNDECGELLKRKLILGQAPRMKGEFILVPRIIGEDS